MEPRPGYTLSSWSLEDFVPPLTPYGDEQGCYYVYYTRGTGEWAELEFWLEVEVSNVTGPSLLLPVFMNILEKQCMLPLSQHSLSIMNA